ncbi:E3 ubiquitin-protein ligase AIRP2-like isoform X2 [Dendrobium catenatum]|uniref:E3 ubiquitin-protein ligase AIRP2-like isoform X2 n=1 Tax=Dendrobium catenatum TaxID=906689 RepID=UPI00109FA0E5|nr:E3 ubiquitin-protein ligase AIRP2-like isoform X2 [Dendrobium catenatum]
MRNSVGDSLKSLLADIELANTLASEFQSKDGAYLQMMMSYSPAAKHFLCIAKWADCSLGVALGLAGAFGLLRVLICEMQKGIAVIEDYNRMPLCIERGRKIADAERRQFSELDIERDEECGICMELNGKIVIPNCCHAMCFKCYSNWNSIQQSCPFCRESLSKVKPDDLWVYTDDRDIVDLAKVTTDDLQRLYLYIDKLPSMGGPSANTVLNVDDSLEKSSSTNRLILSTNLN